jgi:hypothetical protein
VITAVAALEPITRDSARAAAQRELSKGIYHRYDDPWPVRAFRGVQRWIGDLLDTVGRHSPGGDVGAVALLVAAVVLVAVAWWRVGPVRRSRRLGGAVLDDRPATTADHLREASEAAAAGRWGDAVVARMRALALALEDGGVLDPRPGRTADELAREVGSALPAAADRIRRAAQTFDAVAYGRRVATAGSYEVVVNAADAVRELTGDSDRRVLIGRGA